MGRGMFQFLSSLRLTRAFVAGAKLGAHAYAAECFEWNRTARSRSGRRLAVHPLVCTLGQLGGAAETKLLHDMRAMSFNCFYTQMKLLSDLAGAMAPPDEAKYFQFTIA